AQGLGRRRPARAVPGVRAAGAGRDGGAGRRRGTRRAV
ncbi:MAG: hypothetical protein AVDCRST_MAG49-2667, partial [uncultured Thermomicrobiales bacterium]